VFEPQPAARIAALSNNGLRLNPSRSAIRADVIVVAVKPQTAAAALADVAGMMAQQSVVISIMAGPTLGFLSAALPDGSAIVRAMPNTPASIGRGITVAVANEHVTPLQRGLADALLAAVGEVEWVTDEKLMDAVTAVSGSGPAYVFLLAESLARAGVAAGLPEELATRLARVTVAGAGELLHRSALDAAELRRNVTSPGGTTAAAVEVLMGGIDPLMERAVAAATRRSRELGG
jgi:pyrroline-5-carboxylate reductase